jgi:hypothetical protein
MIYYGFKLFFSGFNLHDANFFFAALEFEPDQVFVIATKSTDNCTLDKIQPVDNRSFKVFIKEIERESMNLKAKFGFHIIYSTKDGKLFKQTITYEGETNVGLPIEIIR